MRENKLLLKQVKIVFILLLIVTSTGACANEKYDGKWDDNGNRITRIGNLTIKDHVFLIHGVEEYKVSRAGKFGEGETYKVISVNQHPDPLGCGPDGKVTYISILPQGELAGLKQESIMLIFYSGGKPPKIKTYKDDKAVCEVHPYSKSQK